MWVLILFDLPTETKKRRKPMWILGNDCCGMDLPCFSFPSMSVTAQAKKMQMYIYFE